MTVGVFAASKAYARLAANTIYPTAVIARNGRHITVTGPVTGTAGELGFQRVTVSPRSTGAVAEGYTVIKLSGSSQQWEVQATTLGETRFDVGPTTAVAICQTRNWREATDAHQWLVNVDLVADR